MKYFKPRALARFATAVALAGVGVVGATGRPHAREGQSSHAPCVVASAAGAQKQPSPPEDDTRRAREAAPQRGARAPLPMPPFDFGWGGARNRPDLRAPRQGEWAEVQKFMGQYSPLRQAAVDQLPDDDKKEQIKKFVFARYKSLQALLKRDPQAYQQRLTQLTIEDQIFGMVSHWEGAGAEPQEDRQQLRAALRPQVTKLIDLDLQERARRVEWLKKELADQSAQLERDEKDKAGLIERRVSRFAEWAGRWAARRAQQAEKDGGQGSGAPNVDATPSKQPARPDAGQKPN